MGQGKARALLGTGERRTPWGRATGFGSGLIRKLCKIPPYRRYDAVVHWSHSAVERVISSIVATGLSRTIGRTSRPLIPPFPIPPLARACRRRRDWRARAGSHVGVFCPARPGSSRMFGGAWGSAKRISVSLPRTAQWLGQGGKSKSMACEGPRSMWTAQDRRRRPVRPCPPSGRRRR